MEYELEFIAGERVDQRFTCEGTISVGSSESCQIQLAGEEIAPEHARFEERGEKIVVLDCGSPRPVLVNGQPVTEEELSDSDLVDLGDTTICFYFSGSEASEGSAASVEAITGAEQDSDESIEKLEEQVVAAAAPISISEPEEPLVPEPQPEPEEEPAPAPVQSGDELNEAEPEPIAQEPDLEPVVVGAKASLKKPAAIHLHRSREPIGRRTSKLFRFTMGAVGLTILAQITFVIYITVLYQNSEKKHSATKVQASAGIVLAPDEGTEAGIAEVPPVTIPFTEPITEPLTEPLTEPPTEPAIPEEPVIAPEPVVPEILDTPPPDPQPPSNPVTTKLTAKDKEHEQRKQMMMDAVNVEIKAKRLTQADVQLGRILKLYPDYLAAYKRRATVKEKQKQWQAAIDQWKKILSIDPTSGVASLAEIEIDRLNSQIQSELLAKNENIVPDKPIELTTLPPEPEVPDLTPDPVPSSPIAVAPEPEVPDVTPDPVPSSPIAVAPEEKPKRELPAEPKIRILSADVQRFDKSERFDEMRLLTVVLKPSSAGSRLNGPDIRMEVKFFDRDKKTKKIAPTSVIVPESIFTLKGRVRASDPPSLNAAYVVPKGFRTRHLRTSGQDTEFYGYQVRIYHRGVLQAQSAKPAKLLDR